jgi:putative nucleotidyltransferase with HDIG domain
MRRTEQNPRYHAEGNVLTHTEQVVAAYQRESHRFSLDTQDHEVLYWAAVLHDIGKPLTTHWRGNRWSAKGHERAGVAPARDLLLAQPKISPDQRRRILDLVQYHAVPLQWGLRQQGISAYKRLATRLDLRMLGIFAYFDIVGRICEKKTEVLDLIQQFNQRIVSRVQYEMGTFAEMQTHYQQANFQQKNALWYSTKHDLQLTEKLLQAKQHGGQPPRFTCLIPVGVASQHQAEIAQRQPGAYKLYDAAALGLHYHDPHTRESQLRQLKHFISVYGRDQQRLVIDGLPVATEVRSYVADYCRQQGGFVEYLFIEQSLDCLLNQADDDEDAARLRRAHAQLETPHPWEAHRLLLSA